MSIILLTWFRYSVLYLVRVVGSIYRWLSTSWRPLVIWLAVTAFGVFIAEWLAVRFHLFNVNVGSWFQLWNILGVYTLLAILWWAWRARKRVVVEEFQDYVSTCSESNTDNQSKSNT